MGGMQKSVQTQMLAALIRFLLQFFPKIRLCTTNNCREPSALNLQNPGYPAYHIKKEINIS